LVYPSKTNNLHQTFFILTTMGQNWEDKVAAWKKTPFYLKGN
jgi:hypothetical protein